MARPVHTGTKPVASNAGLGEYERRFYDLLGDLFIGVPIEGRSGYVNLMRIKSQYYQQVMQPAIQQYVQEETADFPDYREDLFTKLYTFLKRYIHPETGSLGLFFTPYHESVYERVYTDDRDVMLFWKTSRLYYVKTDVLFRSMDVEIDGYKFHFDASQVEHKRSNEKRKLEYCLVGASGREIRLAVKYVESSRHNPPESSESEQPRPAGGNLLTELKSRGVEVTEEALQQAIRQFERQSQVDFFLCKDAKSFLREQFDLWMWQYLLGPAGGEPDTEFNELHLRKLQVLKRVAYRVIDFIAAFEDELVKIWNKPKFVLNSNYVITLDRIVAQAGGWEVLEAISAHPNFGQQLQEWRELGMVDDDFTPAQIVAGENLIDGKQLHPRYRYLPIDTRYFKDLELRILALFDHLDEQLDGWLIKSENYQALNTILPKWRGKVKCIYIDPPYNTGHDEFTYVDSFQRSSWLSAMHDRLTHAISTLSDEGILFISIDEREQRRLELLLEQQVGTKNMIGPFIWMARAGKAVTERKLQVSHEYVLCATRSEGYPPFRLVESRVTNCRYRDEKGAYRRELLRQWGGQNDRREDRPTMYFPIPTPFGVDVYPKRPDGTDGCWRASRDQVERMLRDGDLDFVRDPKTGDIQVYRKIREGTVTLSAPSNILSECGTSATGTSELKSLFGTDVFDTVKPTGLVKHLISLTRETEGKVILDYFAGSGTTAHAVIDLNRSDGGRRKYILIEVNDYFYTIILPRIKKVVFSDKWKDGKAQADGTGISHFIKYFELESYEQVLSRCAYRQDVPASLSSLTKPEGYLFHADPKLLDVLNVDPDQERVTVDLSRLYGDEYAIDLAETLSNLLGLHIRRICRDQVEFEDGTRYSLSQPDARTLLPLLWWNG